MTVHQYVYMMLSMGSHNLQALWLVGENPFRTLPPCCDSLWQWEVITTLTVLHSYTAAAQQQRPATSTHIPSTTNGFKLADDKGTLYMAAATSFS